MKFILGSSNIFNGFDQFGHYLRGQLQITNCVEFVSVPTAGSGCVANWLHTSTTSAADQKSAQQSALSALLNGAELDAAGHIVDKGTTTDATTPDDTTADTSTDGTTDDAASTDATSGSEQGHQGPAQLPDRGRAVRRGQTPLNAAFRNPTVIGALAVLITVLGEQKP